MIIVWGRIEAKTENLNDVTQLSLEHVYRSRKEPGCLSHSVQVDLENPNLLIFFEEWKDMSALQAHFKVNESKQFIEQITRLTASPPSMKIFDSTQIK